MSAAHQGKTRRKISNFLLQPMVQLRVGLINIVLAAAFAISLGVYVRHKLIQFADVVSTLTESNTEVSSLLGAYLQSLGNMALAAGAVFILLAIVANIVITHRLVGPAVAFKRHINALINGDFSARTKLRLGDAFTEIADDLNRLSDAMRSGITGRSGPSPRPPTDSSRG